MGLSRVFISHLEAGITIAGERTVVLLAGAFRVEPHELIEGTSYPPAKAERLPLVAARYTEIEHQLALLDNDLMWMESAHGTTVERVRAEWTQRLSVLAKAAWDQEESQAIHDALGRLRAARS